MAPTDWNAAGLIQGRTDRPLTTGGARTPPRRSGFRQAGQRVRCLASPLNRAMETAQLLGLEPSPEPRLHRDGVGRMGGAEPSTCFARRLARRCAANEARGLDFPPAGRREPARRAGAAPPAPSRARRPDDLRHPQGRAARALRARGELDDEEDPADKLRDGCAHAFVMAEDGTPAVRRLNIPLERRHERRACSSTSSTCSASVI